MGGDMVGSFGPNGSLIVSPAHVQDRTAHLLPAYATLNGNLPQYLRERAAATNGYTVPQVLGGASPPGLGFSFGGSWARTQQGVMEFSLPSGQVANQEMALRFACENSFVGKAMRIKTLLTCRGLSNASSNDKSNKFFDDVNRELYLHTMYRNAVWLYYTVGSAPILLPEDGTIGWMQLLDPRMVRTMEAYGKKFMYVVPDQQMIKATRDSDGNIDPRNKDYWDALPKSWRAQLKKMDEAGKLTSTGNSLIKLPEDSYLYLENRFNTISRKPEGFDGIPLQPYFSACEQYRMGVAAQFAASFLAKNLIALVSVGDPAAEKENYIRPDDTVNGMLKSVFSNPNQMQYIIGDPTMNVRYISPGKDAWVPEQLSEAKEQLKNLLPGPFWFNEKGGTYADATVEMKPLLQEIDACNDDFDRNFWQPIYERASQGRAIAKKHLRPPEHDRSALMDETADLANKSKLYNNGALDVKSLIRAHGYDPDVIIDRLREQKKLSGEKIFMPAFEQKQNIVAAETYGLDPTAKAGKNGGPGGRPSKSGSKPQAESTTGRQPRPGGKKK